MAIEYSDHSATISCDKCGKTETADLFTYNDAFFQSGWGLYPRARKHKHKCRSCQPLSHRKAHDFVAKKFPIKPS